ncbi:MAG: hypothetical protein ACWA5L_02695 [bacterium]
MTWKINKQGGGVKICLETEAGSIVFASLFRGFGHKDLFKTLRLTPASCTGVLRGGDDPRTLNHNQFKEFRLVANTLQEAESAELFVAVKQANKIVPFYEDGVSQNRLQNGSYAAMNYGFAPPYTDQYAPLYDYISIG